MDTDRRSRPRSARFERRRNEILDAASAEINVVGTRGMTLTAVARRLGLDTSSVTYYFKRKEALAAACLERTLDFLLHEARIASEQPTPILRVRALIRAMLDLHEQQRPADVSRLAVLSDMQALEDEVRAPLDALYAAMFRIVRGYFETDDKLRSLLAAMTVLAIIHWMPVWIDHYLVRDFARIEDTLVEFCEGGLGFDPAATDGPTRELEVENAQTRFLHVATDLINVHGYHGASVDRIAAQLGVSIGSFYHHLENKDDLVIACFERSFELLEQAHVVGENGARSHADKLGRVLIHLFRLQLAGSSPLLRPGAYQALPPALRAMMFERTDRLARHWAGIIADGVAEGSVRHVDPMITANCLIAIVSTASIARPWVTLAHGDGAAAMCCELLANGLTGKAAEPPFFP